MEAKVFLGKYLIWVMVLLGQLHGYKSCIQKERNALLELKKYLITKSGAGPLDSIGFGLLDWTNDTKIDCCMWNLIKCNRTSKRVTEIGFGQLYYKESFLLNLSLLHPFEEIRNLDLSYEGGEFWPEVELNPFNGFFDDVEGYQSLRRLRHLEIMDLSLNSFNNNTFRFLNASTSLTTLFLRSNNMDGPFPMKELKDLTNLELLDLSRNKFNGSIPVRELSVLRKLKALDLSDNEFSGSMELQGICELKNMQELDLSKNKLVGLFPLCLTSLTGLRVLDLSSNRLTGKLPSALTNLESLEYLSLYDNNFEGFFSLGWLANFSKLKVLRLGSTSNSLQVESESLWKPKFQLRGIVLRSCNLTKVPHFLLHQKDLRHVDLSDNYISGNFPSWLLANDTELKVLLLGNNYFTRFQLPKSIHYLSILDVSDNEFNHLFPKNIGWILPRLSCMNMSKNGFQGNLPSSIGNIGWIEYLDLSHNNLQGKLPGSLGNGSPSLHVLKLSHNKLSGEIFPGSVYFPFIFGLSLDNNQFTGVGQGLRSLKTLDMIDISDNNLTGVVPSWFDELPNIGAILLSNNSLGGEIPASLFNMSRLWILDLSANLLSGDIPPHVNSRTPLVLLLQDNFLSGVIPHALLAYVAVLDLRNNRLSGNIPKFINTLRISILLLRGNNLTGCIPRQLCGLRNIHLLDLANNRLNGSIPSCLSNTSFGLRDGVIFSGYDPSTSSTKGEDGITFIDSLLVLDHFSLEYGAGTQTKIEFATKHRYDAYMGGNLKLLFGIDLSENKLSGEIPVELGDLLKLQSLNLSHNNLSGVIPATFSSLKNVESLDLSFNRLQGRIPPQLSDLSSLAVFNLSYNNLSGVIPQGRQISTFDTQSFLGNPLLCGKPTNRSCNGNDSHEPNNKVEADDSAIDMVSFYWSFAAAYVTILVGIFASLSFDSPWSRFWFYIVDVFIHKVKNMLW